MSKYLISFPSSAMDFPPAELAKITVATHAVVREARAAGVWVFGGGIDEATAPVLVKGDGTFTEGTYPETATFDGGFAVLELPHREAAVEWAARLAAACQCAQELRVFGDDALS